MRKTTALLALFLQLFVLIAVPAAEAQLEAGASATVVHVEAESSESCLPLHDASHCVLCQTLGGAPIPSGTSVLAPLTASVHSSSACPDYVADSSTARSASSPRAPPVV